MHGTTARYPKCPSVTYKNAGWNGLADWLGKKKRSEYLPYEEAKKVVNALGLKSQDDWDRWSRGTRQISQVLFGTYINKGWNGLADWLGKKKGQHFCL